MVPRLLHRQLGHENDRSQSYTKPVPPSLKSDPDHNHRIPEQKLSEWRRLQEQLGGFAQPYNLVNPRPSRQPLPPLPTPTALVLGSGNKDVQIRA